VIAEAEPEAEPDEVEEPVSETSTVDQARSAEEARAIADERAAMLAARQKEMIEKKPVSTVPETEYKKRRVWPWILGIGAVVIIALAIAWFIFPEKVNQIMNRDNVSVTMGDQSDISDSEPMDSDEQKPESERPDEAEVDPAETQSAANVEDEAPRDESAIQQTQTTPDPALIAKPAGKQYYIIAGSFANPGNAENLVKTLKSQGFNSSIIGKRNNLYTVCFSSHSTKNTAEEELARIRNTNDAQAWLLYY